jgi:hypothetical protein
VYQNCAISIWITEKDKMKKLLFSLILVVVSGSAMAEWIPVSKNFIFTLYSDPTSISKSGNMVKMLRLTDFKIAQGSTGTKYLSTKRQDEYDCVKKQHRIIYVTAYSKNMEKGYIVMKVVNEPDDWKPVSLGSLSEGVWKFACEE